MKKFIGKLISIMATTHIKIRTWMIGHLIGEDSFEIDYIMER